MNVMKQPRHSSDDSPTKFEHEQWKRHATSPDMVQAVRRGTRSDGDVSDHTRHNLGYVSEGHPRNRMECAVDLLEEPNPNSAMRRRLEQLLDTQNQGDSRTYPAPPVSAAAAAASTTVLSVEHIHHVAPPPTRTRRQTRTASSSSNNTDAVSYTHLTLPTKRIV